MSEEEKEKVRKLAEDIGCFWKNGYTSFLLTDLFMDISMEAKNHE